MTDAVFYIVGGYVRDKILGVESKDVDYAVEAESYDAMRTAILGRGGTIYVEHPEYFTLRGKMDGVDADFVLCRKDGAYVDGRRPTEVAVGTIDDDLARRDFTINAIAMYEDGELYDPYGGQDDIRSGWIDCVGDPYERFAEDTLRIIRALRFAVTKNMSILPTTAVAMTRRDLFLEPMRALAIERVRDELHKMFKHDTIDAIETLSSPGFKWIRDCIFELHNIWLEPTMRSR